MLAFCSFRDVMTAPGDGQPMTSTPLEHGYATKYPAWTAGGPAHVRAIPLRPLWTGLVVDTLVYGVVLWLAFISPFGLLRLVRRRHDRCLCCGYPIGDASRCTECGADVSRGRPPARSQRAKTPVLETEVERIGLEPTTPALQRQCSPN